MADGSRNASPRIVVGVDVGGTFTDLFFYDEANGVAATHKVPSTRGDQSLGFLDGVGEGLRRDAIDFAALAAVVHGTTVGPYARLDRTDSEPGLLTTAGLRDALEMRRRDRRQTWGLWGEYLPIIPRDLRIEVPERTLADGSVRTAVDVAAVHAAAEALRAAGCDAVAIVFINA